MYYPIFLFRRVLYLFLIFGMTDKPSLAIMINALICILFTTYIMLVKPFKFRQMNNLQIFNEICVLMTNYHMLLFTDFIQDAEIKFKVGWSLIALSLFMILGNVFVMLRS